MMGGGECDVLLIGFRGPTLSHGAMKHASAFALASYMPSGRSLGQRGERLRERGALGAEIGQERVERVELPVVIRLHAFEPCLQRRLALLEIVDVLLQAI